MFLLFRFGGQEKETEEEEAGLTYNPARAQACQEGSNAEVLLNQVPEMMQPLLDPWVLFKEVSSANLEILHTEWKVELVRPYVERCMIRGEPQESSSIHRSSFLAVGNFKSCHITYWKCQVWI